MTKKNYIDRNLQTLFANNKIKAVIFDVDGLLVDTEKYQWLGWVEVLKPYHKTVTKKQYLKYAGKQGDLIESELLSDLNLSLQKNILLVKKEALLIEWFTAKRLHLMSYAREALGYFKDLNLILAAASGSKSVEAVLKLKKTGIFPYFQQITGGDMVKRGKPFPDTYIVASKSIAVKPEFCLAFEDTQYGVESAKSAGMYCIAVPNEFSRKQDFSLADGIVGSLKDVVSVLTHKKDV